MANVLGGLALAAYGVVATVQPDNQFGRVAAERSWRAPALGDPFDGFRPDRYDGVGAAVCLVGVGVIMYVPR